MDIRLGGTIYSDDDSWAVNTAAGWHRCLDVFVQIVNGQPIEWHDNATELRKIYSKALIRNVKYFIEGNQRISTS